MPELLLRRKNGLYFLIDQEKEIPITRDAFAEAEKDHIRVLKEPGGNQIKLKILARKRDLLCGISHDFYSKNCTWAEMARKRLEELEAENRPFIIEELVEQLKRLYGDILESDEIILADPCQLPDYIITIRADETV